MYTMIESSRISDTRTWHKLTTNKGKVVEVSVGELSVDVYIKHNSGAYRFPRGRHFFAESAIEGLTQAANSYRAADVQGAIVALRNHMEIEGWQ